MTPVRLETTGTEAQPLVILDDFAPEPAMAELFGLGLRGCCCCGGVGLISSL
ncbi:hypothetical protein FG91_04086 [Sphingopyxis sp. LC81]|nr:hypothetical protein FG91_04086 [Sphingopyxis sp. LC81]